MTVNVTNPIRFWSRYGPAGKVALRYRGDAATYTELDQQVNALTCSLQAEGVAPGDRVALMANNSLDWCRVALATLRLGAILVPVNPRLVTGEVAYQFERTAPRLVFTDPELADVPRAAVAAAKLEAPVIELGGDAYSRMTDEAASPGTTPMTGADDPAMIVFTSGTTGDPKGALLTHGNILSTASDRVVYDIHFDAGSRLLLPLPLAFAGGFVVSLCPGMVAGAETVLERVFDPATLLDLLVRHQITGMQGVPILWQAIAADPAFATAELSAMRWGLTGGAPVPLRVLETWRDRGVVIRQCYGLTEASGFVTALPEHLALNRPESAGVPSIHCEVRIVDDRDLDQAPGEPGEILVRGPGVMREYWDDPHSTKETLVGGWLRTGDIGVVDEHGLVTIVDRKKSMIISGGMNIYPAEVERALGLLGGIQESCVIGVPDARWGEAAAAIIVADAPLAIADVIAHCRRELADFKVPRYVVVEQVPLPRTSSGKIARSLVIERFRSLPDRVAPAR